jgi:hypothetical protein
MLVYGKNPTDSGTPLDEERVLLPEGPAAAEAARHTVVDTLDRWGWGDLGDAAALCVSELVGELCTETPSALELIVRRREDHVRILVKAMGEDCRIHHLTNTGADRARAFGLIDRLVPLWGVVPRVDGDMVWLELRRDDELEGGWAP